MIFPEKALPTDRLGRFREIVSDPLNAKIHRHPMAGTVADGLVTLHNGIRVPISGPDAYYGAFSEILIINRGVHEPLEEYIFQELLKSMPEKPVMLELGSYWGHYSMWLKSARPDASLCLVDCDAANLLVGKRNFLRNGLTGDFMQATVRPFSYTVDNYGPRRLDILHIDVQGAEVDALAGCEFSLQDGRIDYVFVSTHSQELHRQVVALLAKSGYRIEVNCDLEETTAFDGLVFASRAAAGTITAGLRPRTRRQIIEGAI